MVMITTTKGLMDKKLLEKKAEIHDDEEKTLQWIEYWFKDELVHRSVHIKLKRGVEMFPIAASV